MKIVKRYKWYKKKENKNIFHKIKIKKNVITYLIKIWLCIGMLILYLIQNKNNIINNKSKTKVCLCCAAKKENLYISEFINHYKNLGYTLLDY